MPNQSRRKYNMKYTAASYADAIMSIPIWAGEIVSKGLEKVLGENTPNPLTWSHIQEKSEIFRARKKLRENLILVQAHYTYRVIF